MSVRQIFGSTAVLLPWLLVPVVGVNAYISGKEAGREEIQLLLPRELSGMAAPEPHFDSGLNSGFIPLGDGRYRAVLWGNYLCEGWPGAPR